MFSAAIVRNACYVPPRRGLRAVAPEGESPATSGVQGTSVAQDTARERPGRAARDRELAELRAAGLSLAEQAAELVGLWREGLSLGEVHARTGVAYRTIRATIAERATDADRAARERTHRRAGPSARFSDRDLTRGLRAVAARYHHSPSLREYDLIAPGLYLASGQTVYTRFGGWRRALAAAGLDSAPPTRIYSSRWHIAACWRALERVADQLGDPPRSSRYAELAARREDLPSPPTLRVRLGPWPQIAGELMEQQARAGRATATGSSSGRRDREPARDRAANGVRAAGESIETERLPTQVEVAALRHLDEHPGSSGIEVRRGAGIRSASQTWTLLARLEREGLLVNEADGSGRAWKNAWRLSARGENVLDGLPEGMYA